MTILANTLILRVADISQDKTSIRWPVNEVVRALNDAQREIILYRPDAKVVNKAAYALAPGAKQALPSTPTQGIKLLDVTKNGVGKAVRLTNREILDAQTPGWYNIAGTTSILHYTYDIRDPQTFYVYPPALAGATLDIVYCALPVDIAEVPDGSSYASVTGNIDVPDIYANTIVDFMLYKIYLKDSEYAGNAARAQAHYTLFANALGIEFKALSMFTPTSAGNPNTTQAGPKG